MRPDNEKDREFENHLAQLLQLLKKMMGGPSKSGPWPDFLSSKKPGNPSTINLCFFNFFPMTPEELDELDELYQEFLPEDGEHGEGLNTNLSSADLDFLRENGIRF